MANTRCYFDMRDICVAYDIGGITFNLAGMHSICDSGLYDFPGGYSPLGLSAEKLYLYAKKGTPNYA